MSGYGTIVLGSATTTTAAIVLPNTGSSSLLRVASVVTLGAGLAVVTTTVVRLFAKRGQKD